MSVYDDIEKLYDESSIYNNEFVGYQDDFSFWKYWIKKIKPQKVLEVGIGNGRLIKLLSPFVPQYDGVEISKNIIKDFIEKNSDYQGRIYNQDMKNINIDCVYELILVPFNTFSYLYTLKDIRNFFNGIKKISDNNTIIVIDIFNPTLDDLKNNLRYRMCATFNINENKYDLYEKHYYDSVNQIIT